MTQSLRCSFCGIESNEYVDTLAALPTPTLDQLLHSNTPPTFSMETIIKTQLTLFQDRIKVLDGAIENLQKVRSSLKQEETDLTSVLSPIRRIPPEILSEIFTFHIEDWWERLYEWQLRGALPDVEDYKGWDDFEGAQRWDGRIDEETRDKKTDRDLTDLSLRPTNVLAYVCRSWRTVARACSNLWSSISLHHDYRLPAAQTRLTEQLRLAMNRPLRVHTSYQFWRNRNHDQHLFPLLRDILPTSHRWTSINMLLNDPNHPVFPRSILSSPFPSLVSLSLIFEWSWSAGVDGVYEITKADAPLLREVSLGWADEEAMAFDLPWAQLLKLRFWGGDGAYAIEVMSKLRDVVELDLLGLMNSINNLNSLPLRSLPLPFLRCLRLSNVGCDSSGILGSILKYLQVPSLQTLYWTGMRHSEMMDLCMMCKQRVGQDKGQQVLRHLHLYNPTRDVIEAPAHREMTWGPFLDSIGPQLESLKIEYPISSGANATDLLESLVHRIKTHKQPHFHACTLQGVHVSSGALAELIACVESHKCDIRVLNCTFDTQEEFDDAFMRDLQDSIPKSIPDGTFFELDVEAPNHTILYYLSKHGAGLEERCGCRSEGMSLRRDKRSSVLGVV